MRLDLDFPQLIIICAVAAMALGIIPLMLFVTNDTMPPTTEAIDTQTDWSDDFSADTSAQYTASGTGSRTWDTTNGVLNLTGQDLGAVITGETFGAGEYSVNISFKAATNPGSAMLIVAR